MSHSVTPLDGFVFIAQFDITDPKTGEVMYHRGDYLTPAKIDRLARSHCADIIHVSLCTSETAAGFALMDADIQYSELRATS